VNNEEQLAALGSLVEDWAVKKDRNVKGPFTSGDYVTYRLNEIFTPPGWSFTILSGPEVVTINEATAYVRLVGRLTVRFANGRQAHQDDIGIWPLKASGAQNGGTLETTTAPERYETAEKAARTDCLKNAARNLGVCFGPTTDLELLAHIKRQDHMKANGGPPRSAAEDAADLFGEDTDEALPTLEELLQETKDVTRLYANGLHRIGAVESQQINTGGGTVMRSLPRMNKRSSS